MTSTHNASRPRAFIAPDQERAFANKLLEMLAVPAFVLDAQGRVILWNRACERLTGVPAREMLGTQDHWRSFYDARRPTLADLVIQKRTDEIDRLYLRASRDAIPANQLCAESW